jgi:hypothetical protein
MMDFGKGNQSLSFFLNFVLIPIWGIFWIFTALISLCSFFYCSEIEHWFDDAG